jgi:type II secretory pathway component PulF
MRFTYRVVDDSGELRSSETEAPGLRQAAEELRGHGWTVLELRLAEPPAPRRLEGADAFVFFNQSLAELTRAGIPLTAAVREAASGLVGGRLKDSLRLVEQALRDGRPLDEALGRGDFPPTYRWLVRAGLAAGRLPAVLTAVAVQAEAVRRLKRGIVRALVYPALVLGLGLVMSGVLVSAVLPLYDSLRAQISMGPADRMGLGAAYALTAAFLSTGLGAVLFALFARRRPSGERFLWRIWLLGPLLRALCVERFFGSLQILVESGVPLVHGAPVACVASGSSQLASMSESLTRDLAQGRPLGASLGDVLPISMASAVQDAERRGSMAETLAALRTRLADESESGAESLLMVLEPSAILATGAIMLGVYLSLIGPYLESLRILGRP